MRFFKVPGAEETSRFYSKLALGDTASAGFFSMDRRFNLERTLTSSSVHKFYCGPLREHLSKDMKVGDFGCGNGIFLPHLAALCREVVALDASPGFVEAAKETIAKTRSHNVIVQQGDLEALPFESESFDRVVLMDVIHHLQNPAKGIEEVMRVLKPSGKLIIFEPNIMNPALLALCVLDRNEWGVLRLGRKSTYRKLLARHFEIETLEYNSLLIGLSGWPWSFITTIMNLPILSTFFDWLKPKIFIVARVKESSRRINLSSPN